MSDDLINEMSTRLGRTVPEVEKAFAAFASALQDRVRSEGEANLAGLGVIRAEAGGPRFEPSDALSQAVNYRWLSAGAPIASASGRPEVALSVMPAAAMTAVEPDAVSESDASAPISVDLSPEQLEEPPMPDDQKPIRKVSWAPIGEVDPTDLAGQPTTPASKPVAPKPAATAPPVAASPAAATPPSPSDADKPAATTPKPAATPPKPPATPPKPPAAPPMPAAVAETPPAPAPSEDALVDDLTYESLHQAPEAAGVAAAATGAAGTAAGAGRSARAGAGQTSRSRRSGSGEPSNRKPLLIILGLIAIVAVGWVLINQFGGGSDGVDPAVAETENTTPNPAAESGEAEVDPAGESTDPTSGSEGAQQTPPAAAASSATIDPNSSGYTLIVGSSLSRSGAETEMNRFSNLGYPVALLTYPDGDGQTRHRIAVGEFATAGAADSARRAMASRLPNGTWVRRIRR